MNDIKLYYRECGNGFPLVLLHGNGESGEYFKNQIEFFSKTYRVIAVDTRGHGKSPRGEKPFNLGQFADDLKDLLDSLVLKEIYLLGFSDGANIALLFTLAYPSFVKKLILNGADLFPSGVKASVQIPIVIGYAIVSFISLFDKKAIPNKEILGLMVKEPHINPHELSKITAPTLVIVGTKDMIKAKHSRLISASIKSCKFEELDGDHFIAAKQYKAFNSQISVFLKG